MRLRIATSLAAMALVLILVISGGLLWLLDEKEEAFIESQLSDQIDHSMLIWQKSPDAAFPNTPAMWLYRVAKDGSLPPEGAEAPPSFAQLGIGNHEIYLGSKEYHVAVREDEAARYILAYDVEDHESRLDELVLITLASAVLLALLTLYVGYWLAGRLTRRLERLAERVAADDPGPLVEAGMERELHALADALDQSRQRQRAMLERERAFAANLSHELRTPLTGIRTDAELLAALPGLPESVAQRGERIVSSVDRINGLASSLLMLAREAKAGPAEAIPLAAAIATVWASVHQATPKTVGLQQPIAASARVQADPALFDLVLRNLLDNALRYSEAGDIVCVLDGSRLTVRDTGPGFPEPDLLRIFDRFFIGPRGANGVGLALVRHVCTACGWQVTAANVPGGGGEITLDLGASVSQH